MVNYTFGGTFAYAGGNTDIYSISRGMPTSGPSSSYGPTSYTAFTEFMSRKKLSIVPKSKDKVFKVML